MIESLIVMENVYRSYEIYSGLLNSRKKTIQALKNISLDVQKGEIFGLLGPNGAGKTTTIKILTTLLMPDSGNVTMFGKDIITQYPYIRERINCLFGGERSLYWRISAEDNLKYFADLYKIPYRVQKKRIPELLEKVDLTEWAHVKVENFSKGMKQRLQIARCLINNPEILFLDEPTIGLDPVGAKDLRQLITNLKSEKKTIILTTHYMHEAEELCSRAAFINKGSIIALDTIDNLKRKVQDSTKIKIKCKRLNPMTLETLQSLEFVEKIVSKECDAHYELEIMIKNQIDGETLLPYLAGMGMTEISSSEVHLEDVYLKLVVS